MSFAPILDPTAYTSETEPKRRLQLAAAALLQRLAADDAVKLRKALGLLTLPATSEMELRERLSTLLGADVPSDRVLSQLIEQLRDVKAFCELDNGTIDDGIGPAGRLIRSGRVELFAGN